MKNTLKPLLMVLAIVLILTSVGIPVGAQEGIESGTTSTGEIQALQGAGTNAAVPGGPGYIMIHPTAFVPLHSDWEYSFGGGGGALFNPGSSGAYYEAAVNLPDGARVIKVVVYYYDNSSTKNIWVSLAAINLDDSSLPILAFLTTSGAESTYSMMEDTSISPDIIDNQSYAYWVEASIPYGQSTDLLIRGIRIDYSYQVNLSLINK